MQAGSSRDNAAKYKQTRSGRTFNSYEAVEKQDFSLIFIPEDSSCLFYAVTLAYLIPVKDEDDSFPVKYKDLFGNDKIVVSKIDEVRKLIKNHNPFSRIVPPFDNFEQLVRNTFRNRVVDFMANNLDRFEYFQQVADEQYRLKMRNPDTWAGNPEIQAISLILKCCIQVDEQVFPLISEKESIATEITLKLFHVNRSTASAQNKNHYNYGLEKWIHEYYHEILIDYTFNLLDKCSRDDSEMDTVIHNESRDNMYSGNNYSDNKKECELAVVNTYSEDNTITIDTTVMCRIKNEVKLDAVWVGKLANVLEKYKSDYKLGYQSVNEHSISILCFLFRNPKHVANIIRIINISKDKDLLKYVFIVLKFVISELYKSGNYDPVRVIGNLKEVNSIKNTFLRVDSSDLDILEFQRIEAHTMNKIGLHEQALELLCNIMEKLMHVRSSNISDKPSMDKKYSIKFYLSLLILSDIAYTKHFMGKCEESYKDYKCLHDKLLEHAGFDKDKISPFYTTYKDVLESKKYKSLLSFNRECLNTNCLNILHIRENVAQELVCLGDKINNIICRKDSKDSRGIFYKAIKCYHDAINLHESNLGVKIICSKFSHDIVKNVDDIAAVYNKLGNLKSFYQKFIRENVTVRSLNKLLNYYYKAFEMHSVRITSRYLWTTHPINSTFATDVTLLLNSIAMIHKKSGILNLSIDPNSALKNFKCALHIFESLHKYMVNKFGKEHTNTVNVKKEIVFINYKIGSDEDVTMTDIEVLD